MLFGCGHLLHTKCRPPTPPPKRPTSNDEDLCKRITFLAIDETDPDPPPIDDCPVCHRARLIQS